MEKKALLVILGAVTLGFYLFLYLYMLPQLISSPDDTHVLVGIGSLLLSLLLPVVGWIFRKNILS